MDGDVAAVRQVDGNLVQRSAVANEHNVGWGEFEHQPLQEDRPFRDAAAEIRCGQGWPGQPVAAIEVHPVHPVAALRQRQPQIMHEPAGHALKEQEAAQWKQAHDLRRMPSISEGGVGQHAFGFPRDDTHCLSCSLFCGTVNDVAERLGRARQRTSVGLNS
jgi:hypothetical protein